MSEIERLAMAVGLSARQRELLASLLAEEGIDLGGEPPITPLHGQGDLQLSFSQQRLWFLQRLEPESPFYNIAVEVRLTGALDIPVLGRALAEVMRRHETLRVAFVELDGEPRVRVAAPGPVHLPLVDLSGLPAAEVRRLAEDLTLAEARRGFDLAAGTLLRVLLLKVDRREHRVVLTLHHIAADGWSLGVLVQEVGALYGSFLRGGRSPLPELPFQYADYAAWQRSWLQGETLEKELAHWRAKLEGADPVLELPFDHPRPLLRSDRGATRILVLPAALAQSVEQLSRREGVSLFMTLLAAFLALLERYTGQQDLVIGYPVANRDRSDIEGLIGVFLNTLVLRVDLSSDPSVRALLSRVRDEVLDAQSHAQLPFERLVEELRVERSLSYNPVFQVLFALQNTPASELEIPGLAVETAIVDLAVAQFDLSCRFEKSGETLLGRLEYSRDLFDGTTIERLAGGFGRLLAAAVADPGRRLSELPLLSEAELHQTVREWSDSGRAREGWGGEGICLPQLCEAQAARSPRAPALTFGEETLSYAELHRRANRLARRLRRLGIGPEARVGVLLERSAELVVALLGVLKAGGAYVPLDPAFPAERLAWMAADAGLAALLTEERLTGPLAVPPACPVLKLDVERRSLAGESEADPAPWALADNLAYVLYTSGSTGRPKGVAVAHRALVNFLASMRERPGLTAGDTLLAVTTISFDIAALEIFLPLVVGARVVLAHPEEAAEGAALARLIARSGATVLQATPATWQMLLSSGEAALAPLQGMCGGEALAPGLAAELAARTRSFWNLYGPTETTVWSTVQLVDGGGTVPIGRPIANTRAVLLDGAGRPVPLGAAGHLHLGGSGVARGYLHRPELTAERFVPDPLSAEPGARLYRTGDLARFLADGTLEYLGRSDQQVKLRGFRIELGEIEAAIRQHPGVREAAVVLLGGTGNVEDRSLAAYVVGHEDGAPAAGDLRSFLQGRLPSYMLPLFFTVLPQLPLTPSGKVDRKALTARGRQGGEAEPGRAPRTPMETLLAEIFAEILKLKRRVGADDNFFELGGHSLLATQVISRLRTGIGVELPLRVLFAKPVVSELARFLESQGTAPAEAVMAPPPPPRRASVSAMQALPLSFSQQRLWFLDQLEPGNSTYNIPIEVELRGRLDVAVLGAAFAEVMRRHEALRTTFHTVEGEPVQVVAERAEWSLPVIDLRALSGRERKQETARLRAAEGRWSFDLERGPLMRSLLLRFGAVQHRMLVTMHHIVSDGWSMGVLVREIGVLYPALLAGTPSPLPELAMQYPAFASWQRRHLSGEFLSSELAWWRGQLAGMPPALELPTDHPRPAVFSGRGGEYAFLLKAESLAGLNRLSREHGATLFMTLLAGFLGLLQRYTGEDDLVVGTPIAGRTRFEIEPLIGLFVNTLVLRVDLSGNPEVASLLERVRETTLSIYAHQEVPFERLVEDLARERDPSRPPLVQVLFVFQNAPTGALELPGLALKAHPVPTETTKLELTCMFTEMEGVLYGRLEYSRDLFDGATMACLAGHLTRLLSGAVEDPRRRLSELPLLSEAERRQLLDWNAAAPEIRGETTLTALFEAQVRRAPDAPAVSFEDDTLSYDELNRRANRLAWELRRSGVGTESRVGVLLERSLAQVVAILGVLKAGGAYVPLDPSAPSERLAFLCADSGIQVLVTDAREEMPVAVVVRLEAIGEELEDPEEDDRDLPLFAGPDHLCYVIYTSGSTGLPKGVQVRHGSVARLLSSTERWFGFGPADVWTLFHSYSFDFSVWELWGALAYGGRLLVVPYWVSRSPEAFWWLLVEEGVTVLNQTPSAFRQLIQADGEMTAAERAGLELRLVIFGGEALDLGSLGPWYERHVPDAPRLVNMYGITETTVHVSYRPLDVADLAAPHRSPIGIAISDLGLRLLDARLELVPVGVPGEICVGGAGLARGYLGRPELTAERFVPDPFSREPGERLYRSGDLARYRPDGELEYLGRRDSQVKVRGFRIELGEIEAALLAHGGVRSAVVLPRQDSSGSGSLVGYVETARGEGSEVSAGELRELLRRRLPEYMVPGAFVLLKSMPLTVNGKLDRKALAALPLEPGESGDAAAAPRTKTEELVARIFAEVLTLERVAPAADFFALGGHSLLATQVASRVRTVFGVDLGVRAVFEAPTVEGLAGRIESRLADPGLVHPEPPDPGAESSSEPEASGEKPSPDRPDQGLPAIARVPREGRLVLSFAQQRLWFLDQLQPGSILYNIPVAVRLTGNLNQAALAATFAEIVRRHEMLRTTFQVMDGEPVQVLATRAEPALPLIDLRSLPDGEREEEASRLAVAEARRPFDLARGPLLRVTLLKIRPEQHVILLTMHHIVSDGWSSGVLVRELGMLYAAFLEGTSSPLPELAVQYADFAAWQRQRLSGEFLESELAWWHEQLTGIPPALELPTDHPRSSIQRVEGAALEFMIDREGLAGLNRLSRRNEATLFMTLLGGFMALLQRYTGVSDLAVGTPIAGRTRVETEPLIGLFVNTLILRMDLSGDPEIVTLLSRVWEVTLSAYAHQEVPFERLVEDLAPERDLSRPPLVQVFFSVQNAPAGTLELPGLALEASSVPTATAKFELTCTLMETEGGLAGVIEYRRDLFEVTTIERLTRHFTRLLAGMAAADPRRRLSELPLLSPGERHQILREWNETVSAPSPAATVVDLFVHRAAERPDRPAVVDGSRIVTYGELAERSERLAGWLARQGIGPECVVALVAPRSAALVVATVGVARCGAAFLPLDPAHPPARLQDVLRGSGAQLALIGSGVEIPGFADAAPARATLPLISGETWEAEWETETDGAPVGRIEPAQLAYVIYTSGSTGEPKGVMVSHAALLNLVEWHLRAHGLTTEDRCTLVASPAFDASVWELWPALCAGAALRVVDEETRLAPERLLDLLATDGTTIGFLPTPLAERVLELEPPAGLSLRTLLTGGDRLRRVPSGLPYSVGNHYGPTEAAVVSTWTSVKRGSDRPPAIGRPIDHTRAYVLDRRGEPVPAGVAGELCVAGASLARGYLGRPELTADAFRPDPFAGAGERLYRTGDLVRWRVDGELEFLGRIDHQIKLRGVRIEPAEIEAALAHHPAVSEAALLVLEDGSGEKRLVAFVVPLADQAAGPAPSSADLQGVLRRSLPEAMVPSAFVILESLPLTANGKVDRLALSRIGKVSVREVTRFTAPQGPIEEILAEIWTEILGAKQAGRVGAHDDFFSLGGHSLLATQVISRVREVFWVEMPLRSLFEAPTVAELAARIRLAVPGPLTPPLVPMPRVGDLPLSFAQQRLWFLDRLAPDNPFYNIYGAVRLTGALDVEALRRTFQEIVRRHEALRTTFRLAAGRPVQAIAPAGGLRVPLIDLEAGGIPGKSLGAELARLSSEEVRRPFDLTRGPLFRAYLFRLGAREHTLLVNLHHIVSDGWSIGILFSEIATLYDAFSQGAQSPLPELPVQYADFTLWQREWLQGERLEAELGYWRQQLAGIAETLELPYDRPRPVIESFRGGTQPFALPAALVRELTGLTRHCGATPSMTMLAGFNSLLSRYSGQEDIAIGVAIANRNRREIENLIGFFVNTLVVRSDLSGFPVFAELLARVRETALGAYAHQDLPFERLVEELQPDRELSRNPLIQVMFGYQNFPRVEAEIRGLVLSLPEEAELAARTAKFDLTLFLFEDGDRLVGSLEYNSELFEATTVRRLLGHFENLLAAAVAQPETAIALLPLLSEAERHQLALEWNDTGSAYPGAASLQELFEAQVRSTPDGPALLFGESELSYGELNRCANRLAHRLRALGIAPESRVGLCIERSPEMVVGLLGILKAGGAYVPLDPHYPVERLAFMMEDSGLRALVGEERAVARLPGHLVARTELVLLGAGLVEAAQGPNDLLDQDPPVTTDGGSLAYVIYTSGSTGRPKGVGVTHRAVARLVRGTGYADFGPDQVFLQFAPISFDASTLEVWGALLNGSRLALMPAHALSLEELGRALERYRVTTLWLTAGLFHQFVEYHLDLLRPVRQLLAGGDALSASHVRRVLSELPGTRLINGYGPTENTTFTCCHAMQGPERIGPSVPLGRPIANTRVHLLDRWGQPVPLGVAGELCTGGEGLARGYLGRPELTAERFIPDPFDGAGRTPGSRLYRTGDLARHLPDGRIEFLGRIDQQVKIRGFRIEPGEIESRLGEHPAVFQNVVLARDDIPGGRCLVAYVVQNPAYEMPESEAPPEHASQWGEIFDDLYRREASDADPTFNVIGWDSTYTGLPLPRNEMEDWLEDTIGRIVALDPRRVLEIGCGTGMILFRIAPHCELYMGTDVSARALGYVERQLGHLRALGIDRSRIHLLQRSADQLDGMEADSFDTVILNSVAQYFPSADYLAAVIARAIEVMRPGGSIFLGDLRSLPLLAAFHTSLELFQAEPETPLPRLRQKVQARRLQENELVVDPAFFAALRQYLPGISRVEVYPKRGRAHNELTGFRYQVVLRIGETGRPAAVEPSEISWLDWLGENLTIAALRQRLEASRPEVLGLRNVPNARTSEAVAATRLLREAEEGIETVGDLCRRAAEAGARAVEPQDLWDLAWELPYEVELSWVSPGATGCFEAVLRRRDTEGDEAGALPTSSAITALLPAPQATAGPLNRYTNNPLQGQFARQIVPELRAFLNEILPEHMVPASFVLLDALPLSPNGKVDRRRLPAPDVMRPEIEPSLVAPRNATEARLAEIWRELLGIERIGVDDDFFELGGHSLLATQAVSRVREAFGVELPLRTFFEAPSVAAVAGEVEALRLQGREEAPPIVAVPREGPLPLSFSQERLWFLDRLDTRTLAYNESAAFRMEGRLDVAALRWSLDEVLRRHESLRTTFPEVEGQAVQTIQPPVPFEIPAVDLRGLPVDVREAEVQRLALGQAWRPFDLARGPLVRGLLMRLGETEHAVLFSFHHIVFDGWSTGIFVHELSALYGARIAGVPSPLPPLTIHYADFAFWQRRWLRGEVLERQIAYWRERLTGVAALGLATDRPRPVLPKAPSGQRFAVVPPALTQKLRAFSRSRGATLFMTLLAGFQALLSRYTGQDDIAVGSPIANRDRGEVEKLIGFFVNMLVLRTDLSGDPSFGELLDRVRQVAVGSYAHQNLPFEKLVEELRPDRDLRRTPLFQVSFQLLNVPANSLDLAGLSLRPWDFAARSAKFDIELALIDGGERLSGLLDYDADLFDAATMERLLAHLDRLLAGALESPGGRLSELPLLTRAEHSQVTVEWNDTRAALPSKVRLQEMFEAQVRRTPGAVALVFEGEELRYDELNAHANRLAHALRRWGVGPGVRVGLCLERSPEMVAGLLGVLKAGGAYVPLDPSYPPDRLAFMLADARVPVLLTQERLLAALQPEEGSAPAPSVLCLDTQWGEVDGESLENPTALYSVDELAYVIYTSGSTGHPKGAMNSHRAICNRLLWMQQAYGLTGDDRVLQKTPFSFDVSVWEFFWPLATGARLVLARPGGHQDPDYLVQLITRAGITTAHFVPSMLQVFLEAQHVESCTSLRRVICSGEALTAQLERRFFSRFPAGAAPALYNLYGPTEAAVDITSWRCEPESPLAVVPIGRAIANSSAFVLDAHLAAVPIGVPGELYLGGVQLARGYLDRPDLTAERFVPHPFAAAGDGGARLYRTGDQVRRLPGGEIVYLNRLDYQVKVRGFRIELGEVEAALRSLAGVGEGVVIVREDAPGDRRLVAYVTGEVAAAELRRQLRERLPEFMVPAAFVHLPVLPLTPNGKLDRKALPAPDRGPAPGFVAPRTPAEEILAEIWEEVLGLERAGVHDNFFEHGGHSLLAVLLIARIEKRFGKTLSLAALFAAPTVAALALLLSQTGGGQARRSPLVAIKPQGERAPFFCVHPVGGNVLCYLDLARHLAPDQPFYALQSPDPADDPSLPASIEGMAARYLRELRRIQPEGPYRLGGWSMGGLVAFEMARQLEAEGQRVDLVALIDTLPPSVAPGLPPATEEEMVSWFATDLARLLGREVRIPPEELQPLPAEEKLGHVIQLAHAAGLLPEDFGLAQIKPLFAMFAANLQASRSFVGRPYLGSVTLYLSEQTFSLYGPELLDGWRRSALGGAEARTLPGDHYSLLRRPQVELLADELNACLAASAELPVS